MYGHVRRIPDRKGQVWTEKSVQGQGTTSICREGHVCTGKDIELWVQTPVWTGRTVMDREGRVWRGRALKNRYRQGRKGMNWMLKNRYGQQTTHYGHGRTGMNREGRCSTDTGMDRGRMYGQDRMDMDGEGQVWTGKG